MSDDRVLRRPASPSIAVIGLYSWTADRNAYLHFIEQQIAERDPANFAERTKDILRRLRPHADLRPFTEEDRREVEARFASTITGAVMVEALVQNPDPSFDVGAFQQQDPSLPKHLWQVAWNETFLSADGESVVGRRQKCLAQDVDQFRVVFTIHFWNPFIPLESSYGKLSPPPIQPLPGRLWSLAPYKLPG
jgi:hypothetical protein